MVFWLLRCVVCFVQITLIYSVPCGNVLNAQGGKVNLTSTGIPAGNANRTISVWFMVNQSWPSPGYGYGIIAFGDACGDTEFTLGFQLGPGFFFTMCDVVQISLNATDFLPVIGVWNHLTFTYNSQSNNISFCVNSSTCKIVSYPLATSTTCFQIGARCIDYAYNFIGLIADACIWNRVLSVTEIAENFAGKVPLNGLVGRWKGDVDSMGHLIDFVGPNNGTLIGAISVQNIGNCPTPPTPFPTPPTPKP